MNMTPMHPPRRPHGHHWLPMPLRPFKSSPAFTIAVSIIVGLCALPTAVIVLVSGAPVAVVLAFVLAAIPVGPLIGCYLWLDRYEPEPKYLLALALAWGGAVATLMALIVGGLAGAAIGVSESGSTAVMAPVTEEFGKGLFLLVLLLWRRHELDGVLDGIVYAGMVGIGFAFVENILYLLKAMYGGFGPGSDAVGHLFVVRCLMSPFAHPLFTTFIGVGVGIAIASRHTLVRIIAPIGGYIGAVVAHAAWNGSALLGGGTFLTVYLFLGVPAFIFFVTLAIWMRRREGKLLTAALADAAGRGLFPYRDIAWMANLKARRQVRGQARRFGLLAPMKQYQKAAIELGFLHHRVLRGTAPKDFAVRGNHYAAELRSLRPHLATALP